MRTLMTAALAAATLMAACAASAQGVKPYLAAALNDPARAADKPTDARRKTAEVLVASMRGTTVPADIYDAAMQARTAFRKSKGGK